MHRGYTIASPDLTKVLCLSADQKQFIMRDVDSTMVLNKALCLHDLTEAKNILKRLIVTEGYESLESQAEVQNIARLYNKFF